MDMKQLNKITSSSSFKELPVSARELFFRLVMKLGDSSTIKPYSTVKDCKASHNDLRILAIRGFVNFTDEETELNMKSWNTNFLTKDTEISIPCDAISKAAKEKEEKKKSFGESKIIKMTDEECNKLIQRYGRDVVECFIYDMDNYCSSNGKRYDNYYKALITWIDRDIAEGKLNERIQRFNRRNEKVTPTNYENKDYFS